MSGVKVRGLVPVLVLLLTGCGTLTQRQVAVSSDYLLYEAASTQQSQLLAVVDTHSQSTARKLPIGVPSSDWKHLYSVSSGHLIDTDPETGATLRSSTLPGDYQLPLATCLLYTSPSPRD